MEYKNLSEIKLLDMNPRKISDSQFKILCKSIQDNISYFEARPIILSDRTGEFIVIAGNQRYKAAKHLKLKKVPIYLMKDLSLEQEKEIVIRDNISNGDWDWDILNTGAWGEISDLEEWGLDIPSQFKVEPEAAEDDYEIPEEIETDIVLGDLFEIGEHRLLCGDSTDSDQVAKLMNGEKADMVFTDPPYNVDYEGKTKEKLKIQNDKHSLSEFRMFMSDVITNLILFTKKGGCYYVCIPLEVGVTDLFLEKTHLQSVLIWLKNVIVMGRKDYQQKTEPILFLTNLDEGSTEEETYNGIVYGWIFGDSHKYYGGRKQSNVWQFDKPKRNGEHPTMKPILLVAKAINNSSKQPDLVLDLFLGSGSTMVASHQLKRKCYGMELDPKYVQVIVDRMKALDHTLIIKKNGNAI